MLRSPIFYPLAPIRTPARTVFVRGEGSYLYDSCGKRYLDANSGLWNLPLGYGSPNLVRAVAEQAARLPLFVPSRRIFLFSLCTNSVSRAKPRTIR